MKALEEKIIKEGKVLPGGILKVGNFLNQQIDVDFLMLMGKEVAWMFADCGVTKVMTVEASGIAFAVAIAAELHVPAVFAKKTMTSNISKDVYTAKVDSFTHGRTYDIVVPKEYISHEDKILVADDFLACGNALKGLCRIISDAGAETVGAAIEIEKAFQRGGDELRAGGLRVESLAIVEKMEDDGTIIFRARS